jgi:NAD(P)-dependent dehydrogenase (short-subunit alcohol dehydrogenase family)
MTFLVVGASSSIGTAVCSNLEKKGIDYLTVGRSLECDFYWNITQSLFPDFNLPPLSGYVNCLTLGKGDARPDLPSDLERDLYLVSVNIKSFISLFYGVYPYLQAESSVVHIGSLATSLIYSDDMAYCMSKTALNGLSRSIAAKLSPIQGRSNIISPGYVRTPLTQNSWVDVESRLKRSSRCLRGQWAQSEQIASVICFLLSPESSYINAQNISVDDGWSINSTL